MHLPPADTQEQLWLEVTACKLLLTRIFPQPVWESLLHRYREQALHAESKEELFRHPSFALPSPPSAPPSVHRSLASFSRSSAAPSSAGESSSRDGGQRTHLTSPEHTAAPPAALDARHPSLNEPPQPANVAFSHGKMEARFHRWNAKRLIRCDTLRCASAALILIGVVVLLSRLPGQANHAWRTFPVLSWVACTCIACSGLWLLQWATLPNGYMGIRDVAMCGAQLTITLTSLLHMLLFPRFHARAVMLPMPWDLTAAALFLLPLKLRVSVFRTQFIIQLICLNISWCLTMVHYVHHPAHHQHWPTLQGRLLLQALACAASAGVLWHANANDRRHFCGACAARQVAKGAALLDAKCGDKGGGGVGSSRGVGSAPHEMLGSSWGTSCQLGHVAGPSCSKHE